MLIANCNLNDQPNTVVKNILRNKIRHWLSGLNKNWTLYLKRKLDTIFYPTDDFFFFLYSSIILKDDDPNVSASDQI